jgi:1-acyl-sn-glycerol-3-phosphate acyltransferase
MLYASELSEHPWLVAFVVLLLAINLIIWLARARQMTLSQFGLYLLNLAFAKFWWRLRVTGEWPELFPNQGYIIIANHRSSIDPMLIQSSIARPLKWMIAREYTEVPIMGTLLRIIGVVPVNRDGSDRTAIRQAVAEIEAGSWIGIFPEGKINTTDEPLLDFHSGVALMAQRANCAVIPLWLSDAPFNGSVLGAIFIRCRTRLRIGKPIHAPTPSPRRSGRDRADELATFAAQLRATMLELRQQSLQ